MLAAYFLEPMAAHLHKEITHLTPEALSALQAYDWPGNVRELEHVVEHAVIFSSRPVIRPAVCWRGRVAEAFDNRAGFRAFEERQETFSDRISSAAQQHRLLLDRTIKSGRYAP